MHEGQVMVNMRRQGMLTWSYVSRGGRTTKRGEAAVFKDVEAARRFIAANRKEGIEYRLCNTFGRAIEAELV